jgi:imidazole glycerol-phosphate synthase subunit HisH
MMRLAIIDPGSGNLASVRRAFERAGQAAGLAIDFRVTSRAEEAARADRLVLPGQGAFAACRRGLDALPGMTEAIAEAVRSRGRPFLGICVGMQLLAAKGLEFGETAGLGWLPGAIAPIEASGLPLPQMGWNRLALAVPEHALLAGIRPGAHAYFVHSFAWSGAASEQVLATTEYGGPIVAMVGSGNVAGTQFHVEKSGPVGLRLLANFLRWAP